MLKRLLLGAMLITLAPLSSYAQIQQGGIAPSAAGKSLSVSNTSSCVAMTQQNNSIVVWNVGATAAYYNINGATATTGNPQLPAGAVIALSVPPGALLCAITASSTTTLQITQGFGKPSLAWIPLSITATIDTTGLATSAKQDTGNTSLASIDTKLSSQATATNQTTVQAPVAPATATATKSVLLGGQYDSTQKTLTTGQQAAFSASPRGALFVAVGADGFAVTNAGTFAVQAAITAASGSIASGAVASGAYASGSLASGAMVDLVALSAPVAPATATATKSALIGCQATSAGITPTTGQQAAIDCDLNNNVLVSPGGAPNYVTSQVSVTTSDTAVASARALRRQIRITNVTGTQQVWCSGTTAAANTAELIPAVVGASLTVSTTSAIRCIASTGAQTVTVAEIY